VCFTCLRGVRPISVWLASGATYPGRRIPCFNEQCRALRVAQVELWGGLWVLVGCLGAAPFNMIEYWFSSETQQERPSDKQAT